MLFESIPNELILLIVIQCAYQQAARLSCTNSNIRRIVWPEAERMRTDHRVQMTRVAAAVGAANATASCSANLNLFNCRIDHKGATAIAEALRGNRVLTKLDLSYNGLNAEAGRALASALRVNAVLKTLNLMYNEIGDEGAAALASALLVNGVLTNLNLFDNSIGPTGATALADALCVNGVLKRLDIRLNGLGDEEEGAILDAVSGREGFELLM